MGAIDKVVWVLAVAMALFHLTATQISMLPSVLTQNLHLGLALVLVFLTLSMEADSAARRALFVVLAAASIAVAAYIWIRYDALIMQQGFPGPLEVAIGIVLLALVLIATKYRWGLVLPVIALLTLAYYIWGDRLPGGWAAPYTPFDNIISNLSIGLFSGVFGQFMAISANEIFLFMVFGGLLQSLDGNRSFSEIGKLISRRVPGGAGLTTVISSSLMGTVTGAAVANVAISGTYTIPMMKRDGYAPQTAAAIEATASTGGQIVPPVMGSVAFVMAAMLSVPYFDIVKSAIVPAIFFYIALLAGVVLLSRRIGIGRAREAPDLLVLGFYLPIFLVPLGLLTVLLSQLYSVAFAAFYAIASLITVRLVLFAVAHSLPMATRKRLGDVESFGLHRAIALLVSNLLSGLRIGAIQGAGIAVVLGTVGIIAEAITATGAAVPLGWIVESISGQSLFLALLSTAAICIVIGAGVPTVGAYILTAAVAAPIVIGLGVDDYSANFFILYFACLSAVTPPVAAAALAASAMAGSDYMRTAWEATRLSVMLYVLPFVFVYQPALLNRGSMGSINFAATLVELLAASVLAAAAVQDHLVHRLGPIGRLLSLAAAIGLALHICGAGMSWLAISIAAALVVIGLQMRRRAIVANG